MDADGIRRIPPLPPDEPRWDRAPILDHNMDENEDNARFDQNNNMNERNQRREENRIFHEGKEEKKMDDVNEDYPDDAVLVAFYHGLIDDPDYPWPDLPLEIETESEDYDGLVNAEDNINEIESFGEFSYTSSNETDTDEEIKYSDMSLVAKGNSESIEDAVLLANLKYDTIEKDTWIADSGASTHMCMNDDGMFDITITNNQFINVGNGHKLPIVKKGKKKCSIHQKDGKNNASYP